MKLKQKDRNCSYRIALVINDSGLSGSRLISGLCRRATAYPHLMVRRYFTDTLTHAGIDMLVDWKPDALVVYCDDIALLQQFRNRFPHAPVVAMNPVPDHLADAIVAGSSSELAELSLGHFSRGGLADFAMFYAGHEGAATGDANEFRQLSSKYPGSFDYFPRNIPIKELQDIPEGESLEQISAWLRRLPKPVGIYCPTDHSAAYLVRICRLLELTVPKDIQIIGCDELDESLDVLRKMFD
jgi:LacI family transcriptional regulator